MIDFYKHSFLSAIGRDAVSLSDVAYAKKITSKYDEYLEKVKAMKKKLGDSVNNNTEFYL